MTVRCLKCKAKLTVPDEKASSNLKLKCPGCGLVFPLAKAPRVGTSRAVGSQATAEAASVGVTAAGAGVAAAGSAAPSPAAGEPAVTAALKSGSWKKCANHKTVKSENVCPRCVLGYCIECGQHVQSAVICRGCDQLTIRAWEMEESVDRTERRARPLKDEIETIAKYPVSDVVAFVMLSILVGGLGALGPFTFWMAGLLRHAVLMWYGLHVIATVSNGKLQFTIPEFRGVDDIVEPLKLGIAVTLASIWPTIVVALIGVGVLVADYEAPASTPSVVTAQLDNAGEWGGEAGDEEALEHEALEDEGSEEEELTGPTPFLTVTLLFTVFCWMYAVLYTPIALLVAALSRSFIATINPVVGFATIQRLGSSYGEVLVIYGVIVASQFAANQLLGFIPLAGYFLAGFTDVYAIVAIGCLLGMAVDKKAAELGLE